MINRIIFLVIISFFANSFMAAAQSIIDPCFTSISPIGKFHDSNDIVNICNCTNNFLSADLLEWNGSEWEGRLLSNINRPPPEGCNVRGMWIGYEYWTRGGEAFGLRLDQPLVADRQYTYTFTYARDGHSGFDPNAADDFSPYVYTDKSPPSINQAFRVGRLPATIDWSTNSITFTASVQQAGHEWLILHTVESSGTILSNCMIDNPIASLSLAKDTTLCQGDTLILSAPLNKRFSYYWNTGVTNNSINITTPGLYTLEIDNYKCTSIDSIVVNFEDCELRFVMPNIFTPNGDPLNDIFVPLEYNYIESGAITIYNRWGEKIFSGDLFKGWDGKYHGTESHSGIYYYDLFFIDRESNIHKRKGTVTLAR